MHIQQDGLAASQTITYDIDLGGDGLSYNSSLSASQQCPEGTWICMKILSNAQPDNPSDAPEVKQVLPLAGNIQYDGFSGKVDAEARFSIPDTESGIPSLNIILKGGYYLSQPQSVQFSFICDKTAQEPTLPAIKESTPTSFTIDTQTEASDTMTQTFTWSSRYACPVEGDITSPHPSAPWWSSFFNDESKQEEEASNLRPNKGKTAGIVIGSLAGACVLLGGVYYLHSRRSSKTYDTPSLQEQIIQWLCVPAHYLQQIPVSSISSLSFSSIRSFVTKPFSRRSSSRQYRYHPLFAEEYEIQDRDDDENGAVVDLQAQQHQQTAPRIKASRGSMGYGSI